MTKAELKALKDLRADLFYQIEAKHGPEKASKYPSIVKADEIIIPFEEKEMKRNYLLGETHFKWNPEGSYWHSFQFGLRTLEDAYDMEMKEFCENCVNDYDDSQMCKFCKNGSHQTLGQ